MSDLKNTPVISVVIPTYNRAETLANTLHCYTRQSLSRRHFEVIVADDGSSDETCDVVNSFRNTLDLHYLFQPDKGFGAAKARNLGARKARGDFLVFNDDDIAVNNHYLEAHLNVHQRSDQDTLVRGILYGYSRGKPGVPQLLQRNVDFRNPDSSLKFLQTHIKITDPNEYAFNRVGDQLMRYVAAWRFIWGSCISLPKRAFFEAGQFDEEFSEYGGEDLEFAYRCHLNDMHFALERRCWVVHQPSSFDLYNNGARPSTGRRHFFKKFSRPEIELYTVFRRLQYCLTWEKILPLVEGEHECNYYVPALPHTTAANLAEDRVLLLGCGDGDAIESLMPDAATELNRAAFLQARSNHPAVDVKWSAGVSLPWKEKSFAKVIISDYWRSIPHQVLIRIIIEACRLASRVYVVIGTQRPSKAGAEREVKALIRVCRRLQLPANLHVPDEEAGYCLITPPEMYRSARPLIHNDWPTICENGQDLTGASKHVKN